jgi:pilus assembly protein CpaE
MHSFAWWPTVIVLAIASFTDLRNRRIPNWLVLPFLLAGIVVSGWLHGWHGVGQSFAGMGLGLLIYGFLFWMGGMGAGDVKLCVAIGAWIGPDQLFIALVITGMAGGFMVLIWAACGGFLKELFSGCGQPSLRLQRARSATRSGAGSRQSHEAQDTLRTGNRHRNTDFILCSLKTGVLNMMNSQAKYQFMIDPQEVLESARSITDMNSHSASFAESQYPDTFGARNMSIVLIGPDDLRRRAAADALAECPGNDVREFSSYPPGLDDVPRLLEQHNDVIIIDLDSDPEYALELVESIGANGTATVMVYSAKADAELLVRCMRAGAREFLTLPFSHSTMAEALVRASAAARQRRPRKRAGRLLVFTGAKGGSGVTTISTNFAVALAQDSGESTLLIDLDLPLGDAALNLGIVAEYSTVNALQNAGRLDSAFLSKLLVKHSSGVSVLAAPGKFPQFNASNEAVDRLIAVARQDFDNVVVDIGSRHDLTGTALFKDAIESTWLPRPASPNCATPIVSSTQFYTAGGPKLEIVINRYEPRALGVSEEHITKALTRPAQWKIPNDYGAVRKMQNTATPLAMADSPIARLIRQMAKSVSGKATAAPEKKKGFSLFG